MENLVINPSSFLLVKGKREVKQLTNISIVFIFFLPQPTVKLFIDGKFIESKSDKWIDIHNPVRKAALGPELISLEFWKHSGKNKDLGLYCEAHIAAPVAIRRRWGRDKDD